MLFFTLIYFVVLLRNFLFWCPFCTVLYWLNVISSSLIITESAPRPIQSISHNFRVFVCSFSVPSVDNPNQESWRLLIKERIAKFSDLRTFFMESFGVFLGLYILFGVFGFCVGEPAYSA